MDSWLNSYLSMNLMNHIIFRLYFNLTQLAIRVQDPDSSNL